MQLNLKMQVHVAELLTSAEGVLSAANSSPLWEPLRRVFFYVFQGRGDDGWSGGNGSAADVTCCCPTSSYVRLLSSVIVTDIQNRRFAAVGKEYGNSRDGHGASVCNR